MLWGNKWEKNLIYGKVYYKVEDLDENYKELKGVSKIKSLDDIDLYNIDNFYIPEELAGTLSVTLDTNKLKKTLGYNILNAKRFKKLLMSVGLNRNEAEYLNNFFKYNNVPRYEYLIDFFKRNADGVKYWAKKK